MVRRGPVAARRSQGRRPGWFPAAQEGCLRAGPTPRRRAAARSGPGQPSVGPGVHRGFRLAAALLSPGHGEPGPRTPGLGTGQSPVAHDGVRPTPAGGAHEKGDAVRAHVRSLTLMSLSCLACGGGGGMTGPSGHGVDASRLFAQDMLHDIRLEMNARDWETLRANFESNAYYRAR